MNAISNQNQVIKLWPEQRGAQVEEEAVLPSGLKVIHNVTHPSLTVFPADPEKANGTAVIICPGGSWHFLSIDMEGTDVARWLARRGVTAFVLRYRLAPTGVNIEADLSRNLGDPERLEGLMQELLPLAQMDGERAVRLVRERAAEWEVRPGRVGMIGFSAGGHFTVHGVLHNGPDGRPDFAAAIYPPVIEAAAPPDAPPLFLLCASDDLKASEGCLKLYAAWKEARRPVELHIYSKGGHGFGMTRQGLPSDGWIERYGDWLRAQGLL